MHYQNNVARIKQKGGDMFRRFILSCVCCTALPVFAQTVSISIECQEAIRSGESVRNSAIYSPCGFDDKYKAFGEL